MNKLLTTLAAVFALAQRREWVTRNPAAVAERCRLNADKVAMDLQPDVEAEDSENNVNLDDVLSPEVGTRTPLNDQCPRRDSNA